MSIHWIKRASRLLSIVGLSLAGAGASTPAAAQPAMRAPVVLFSPGGVSGIHSLSAGYVSSGSPPMISYHEPMGLTSRPGFSSMMSGIRLSGLAYSPVRYSGASLPHLTPMPIPFFWSFDPGRRSAYIHEQAELAAAGWKFKASEETRHAALLEKYKREQETIQSSFDASVRDAEARARDRQQYRADVERTIAAMHAAAAHPRLQLHTAAHRPDLPIDRAMAARRGTYFREAYELGATDPNSEVAMRVVCFPRGQMSAASASELGSVVEEVIKLATTGDRAGSIISVLGLASSGGRPDFNEVLSWGRAETVKSALLEQSSGLQVMSAGVYRVGLHVDHEQFNNWFGPGARMASGAGSPSERCNQCAVIVVLPPKSLFQASIDEIDPSRRNT